MKEVETRPGKTYAVECVGEVVVTNTETGAVVAQGDGSGQVLFTACGCSYTLSDDAAKIVALFKSAPGSNVAPGAIAAAQVAAREAKEAAVRAESAAEAVEGAALVGANNEFTETNTFNGALVANGSLLYGQQELGDLLTYPVITRLAEAGINPVSAMARTWDEWVALNPNWTTLEHLLFYAPLLQDASIPKLTSATSVSSCTYISPAATGNPGCQYLLGTKFNIFTLGTLGQDANNCYYGTSCSYYAPRATKLVTSLHAFALSSPANTAELSVFTPELTEIAQINTGTTFRRLGTLKTFSIYAPKLKKSFAFSDVSDSKAQYCSVLQSLVAGIGTPSEIDPETGQETGPQTITIKNPIDNTDENIAALRTAAAEKNWKFILQDGTDL